MGFGHLKIFLDRSFESGDCSIYFNYANSSKVLAASLFAETKKIKTNTDLVR